MFGEGKAGEYTSRDVGGQEEPALSFFHSLINKHISNVSYVLGTLSSTGNMRVNKADIIPASSRKEHSY